VPDPEERAEFAYVVRSRELGGPERIVGVFTDKLLLIDALSGVLDGLSLDPEDEVSGHRAETEYFRFSLVEVNGEL
jgi:hypothetical protein